MITSCHCIHCMFKYYSFFIPLTGSSSITTCGLAYVKQANATLLFWPPLRNFIGFKESFPTISYLPKCPLRSGSILFGHLRHSMHRKETYIYICEMTGSISSQDWTHLTIIFPKADRLKSNESRWCWVKTAMRSWGFILIRPVWEGATQVQSVDCKNQMVKHMQQLTWGLSLFWIRFKRVLLPANVFEKTPDGSLVLTCSVGPH